MTVLQFETLHYTTRLLFGGIIRLSRLGYRAYEIHLPGHTRRKRCASCSGYDSGYGYLHRNFSQIL